MCPRQATLSEDQREREGLIAAAGCHSYYHDYSTQSIINDISLNIDTGKVTALTLLYLSAALDTIDYSVLLDRPSGWYGISGKALN